MGSPYSSQSSSGYNSSPPPDDGTTVAANKITWAKIKSAITDPIKTLADAVNSALRTALNVTPSTTSAAYTTVAGDHLTTIEATGTFTVSLGDAATMIAQSMGYTVTVYNKGTGTVTVGVITATDTLNGHANGTMTLASGQAVTLTVAQSGVGYEVTSSTGFNIVYLTGAAGTNTITAAAPTSLIGLFTGLKVCLYPANVNTGATTLNITPAGGSALTAKNIFLNGQALAGGELSTGPVMLEYDGTQFNILGNSYQRLKLGATAAGKNIAARTNSGAPNTKIDITADELILTNSTGNAIRVSTVSVTIDFAGTGANGIDTGAQASSTWYYGWIIAKEDGTVAGLGSTSASAPTMPSGYTFKALVTAMRSDGSTHFLPYRQFGNVAYYQAAQNALTSAVIGTGETSVSLTALIPPSALAVTLASSGVAAASGGGAIATNLRHRFVSGSNFFSVDVEAIASNTDGWGATFEVPNVSQQMIVLWANTTNLASHSIVIDVLSFKLPVGGE